MKKSVFLKHCGASIIPRYVFKVPHNDPLAVDYTPWVSVYKATCPVCKQKLMAKQGIDDYGHPAGPVALIKPKHHATWQQQIDEQGTRWFSKGHTHVWASRRAIPFDKILVPVK